MFSALLLPFKFAATAVKTGSCTLPGSGSHAFFGFPHWWEYLSGQYDPLGKCAPAFSFPSDIWAVALAVLDMLLRAAGLAAVISIIIAGVSYITAAGNSEQITGARKRIVNSLIGLGIALIAAAIVSFIGNSLT